MSFDLHEECGVMAVFGHPDCARVIYTGLVMLQHRGQEMCGLVINNNGTFLGHKGLGLVREVFLPEITSTLVGSSGIGHVRYSTAGGGEIANAQPFWKKTRYGLIGLGHNGNITNATVLRKRLEKNGACFSSTSDTEIILQLISLSKEATLQQAISSALRDIQGAFSLVFLTPEGILAARDPNGFRPLVIGEGTVDGDRTYTVFASETCALDPLHATYIRDVKPGEIVSITAQGKTQHQYRTNCHPSHCVFEHVYFSRPDSIVFERPIAQSRDMMGTLLAKEHPAPSAEMVVPVPDSGNFAAMGYARESGLPYSEALVRNRYVDRTFIQPGQVARDAGVRQKLNPIRHLLEGKRVVLVDDSIVRGTTSRKIVRMVRMAGALEVHLRIACPPTISPCFYGVDTPSKAELIAANHSLEETCRFIEADSLAYLSLGALGSAVGDPAGKRFCTACYTGSYPTNVNHLIEIS